MGVYDEYCLIIFENDMCSCIVTRPSICDYTNLIISLIITLKAGHGN